MQMPLNAVILLIITYVLNTDIYNVILLFSTQYIKAIQPVL